MTERQILHTNSTRRNRRAVTLVGTAGVIVEKGQLLCFDRDYGTAADADGNRDNRVQLPDNTNNNFVAGVCAEERVVIPASGSIGIDISEPGSVCQVAIFDAVTVAATRLTGQLGSGRFGPAGFGGRGTAVAMQTVAAITSATSYVVGPISKSLDGSATLTISGTTYTVTKTAAFAYVPATANLTGEEYVYILAGAKDNVGSGASITPTAGRYKIVSKTSDDAVVLDPAGTAPAASSLDIAFYCYRGNPTCLAKLDDGQESGLVEWLSQYTDGTTTTEIPACVGGKTNIFGGFDLDVGDTIATLADGTFIGQRKAFELMGAITTNDYVVTLATTGEQLDGTTDLGSLEFDGANDHSVLEWTGLKWVLRSNAGTGLA